MVSYFEAMDQIVITVGTQKGGMGKSTLARALACEWQKRGLRVLLVDADDQGTIADWQKNAEMQGKTTPPVTRLGDNLRDEFDRRTPAGRFDRVVIDTPARNSRRLSYALSVSDFALIPCNASSECVNSMPQTLDLVDAIRIALDRELRPMLVAVREKPNTMLGRAVRQVLDSFGYPVMANMLAEREQHRHASNAGESVVTYASRSQAAKEVSAIVDELDAQIERLRHAA